MPIPYTTAEDIEELKRRIQIDEQRIKRYLTVREHLIEEMKGIYYDLDGTGDIQFDQSKADNFTLEFMSGLMPDAAFQSPRVNVTTVKEGVAYYAAKSLHHGMNRLLDAMNYTRLARRSAADYCVGYSALWRGTGPKPGLAPTDDPIDWPFCDRLNPRMFGFDTSADTWEDREYAYHDTIEYKDDLLERARSGEEDWDIEVLERAPDGTGQNDLKKGQMAELKGKVVYRTVHLPKADPTDLIPDGENPAHYHGVLLTFLVESVEGRGIEQVRPPRAYRGCTAGPYEMIGMNWIPDESLETTVLTLVMAQQKEYADIVEANNQSARDFKRFVVVASKKLANIILKAKNRSVFYFQGLQKDEVQTHEHGGLSQGQDYIEGRAREQRDRNAGMTDAERGALTGDATATENAIANAAATKRRGMQVVTFAEGHERNIQALAELAWINDTTVIDLGPEATPDLGPAAVFFGGDKPKPGKIRAYYKKNYPGIDLTRLDLSQVTAESIPFGDLELRIEMSSMGRKTFEMRLAETNAYISVTNAVFQTLMMNPFVPAQKYKRKIAEMLRDPSIMEMIDDELLQLMRVAMLQGEVPPPAPNGGQPQAQLLGAAGLSREGSKTMQPQNSASEGSPSATKTRVMTGAGL